MDESTLRSIGHLLSAVISFVISGNLTFFITRKYGRKKYDYFLILSPALFWIPFCIIVSGRQPLEATIGQAFGVTLIGGIIGYFAFRKKNKKTGSKLS